MSSNINPYNIDGTFPVAGQDNSSQGFRDNFTNIKNNFLFAQTEIDDLQNKAIVTSALNGQSITNDMAGTQIRRPQLAAWTQTLYEIGAVSGAISLDFNEANFQKITTAEPISLNFINWQSTGAGALGYGLMRVWIVVSSTSHTVTLPDNVNIGVHDIAGYNSETHSITFDQAADPFTPGSGNYVFDFSSIDGGNNFLIFDVTRNRATLRDPNLYFNDSVTENPTLFVGFSQNGGGSGALQTAIAYEQGENIISGLGSFNSVSFGDLSLANTTNASLDTGKIAGYSITSARGNIAVADFQPVESNDYLGYVNAVTYTGTNGIGNTFQQSASMVFYATGSNVEYGLGGNIAFYTAGDGSSTGNAVIQAMGIENDQSVTFFGNVNIVGSLTGGNIVSGGGSSYGNAEVATYLANFDGGINFTASPAIISGLGNISSAVVWTGNLQFIDGSYQTTAFSTVDVAAYLPTDPTILGLQANIGATGPAGNDGAIGATGATGPQGEVGATGPAGTGGTVSAATNLLVVDKGGNNATADGSVSSPFLTIQAAHDYAATNSTSTDQVVIQVNPGRYTEDLTLTRALTHIVGLTTGVVKSTRIIGSITVNLATPVLGGTSNDIFSLENIVVSENAVTLAGSESYVFVAKDVLFVTSSTTGNNLKSTNTATAGIKVELTDCLFDNQSSSDIAIDLANVWYGNFSQLTCFSGSNSVMNIATSNIVMFNSRLTTATGTNVIEAVSGFSGGVALTGGSLVLTNSSANGNGINISTGATVNIVSSAFQVGTTAGTGRAVFGVAGSIFVNGSNTIIYGTNAKRSTAITNVPHTTAFTAA